MGLFRSLAELLRVDPSGLWLLVGAGLILAVATGLRGVARGRRSDAETMRAWRSVGTWWILFGLLLLILASGRTGAVVAMAILSLLLVREVTALTATSRLIPYLAAGVLLLHLWVWLDWQVPLIRLLPPLLALLAGLELLAWLLPVPRVITARTRVRAALLAVVGPVYASGAASLPPPPTVPENQMGWLLLVLLLTELNDMAQSWWGRAIGRRRLAPRLSPGKTWEGLWGGLGTTAIASLFLSPVLIGYPPARASGAGGFAPAWAWDLTIGGSVALAGVAGDLLASSLKRRAGVKDSGALLPGHGGVLDRFDSLALAAPVFFFIAYALWFRRP